MADPLTASERNRWPLDFRIFAGLCVFWSIVLLARSIFNLAAGGVPNFEDVIFGVKFHGDEARVTMALQAIVIGRIRNRNPGAPTLGRNPRAPLHGASSRRPRDIHHLEPRRRVAARPRKDRVIRKPGRAVDRPLRLVPLRS